MASNFQAWLNQADIPAQQNGRWVDLETGHPYEPRVDYATGGDRVRQQVSGAAQDARDVAKAFGGKALTGTAKQKEWAEKIRAAALRQMTPDQAELVCSCPSVTGAAKFWIETRTTSGRMIAEFIERLVAAVQSANKRSRAGEKIGAEEIARINRAQAGDLKAL